MVGVDVIKPISESQLGLAGALTLVVLVIREHAFKSITTRRFATAPISRNGVMQDRGFEHISMNQ